MGTTGSKMQSRLKSSSKRPQNDAETAASTAAKSGEGEGTEVTGSETAQRLTSGEAVASASNSGGDGMESKAVDAAVEPAGDRSKPSADAEPTKVETTGQAVESSDLEKVGENAKLLYQSS